jgi:hypothetical protein
VRLNTLLKFNREALSEFLAKEVSRGGGGEMKHEEGGRCGGDNGGRRTARRGDAAAAFYGYMTAGPLERAARPPPRHRGLSRTALARVRPFPQDWLEKLFDVFDECEDLEDTEALHTMFECVALW